MYQKVIPKEAFELTLPYGWCLSKHYKGYRALFYKETKVASLRDDFNLAQSTRMVINNPPIKIQEILYLEGNLKITELSTPALRRLVVKGIIPYEYALNSLENPMVRLGNTIPKVTEYAGETYKKRGTCWYNSKEECINSSARFLSVWDARVKYAQQKCTIADVAKYSRLAVLECLGDDHQRFINNVLQPKLAINRKGWAWESKFEKKRRLAENAMWEGTEWDNSEQIEQDYQDEVNSCLYHYFFESIEHQVQMFTEVCNVPAFRDIKKQVEAYEAGILEQLRDLKPELAGFRWNSLMRYYEPQFSPKALSTRRQADFYELVHNVIVGKISGYQAALMFSGRDWDNVARESVRYGTHMTQHVPYYTDRWYTLSSQEVSFKAAVQYVISNVNDLITMGYRSADRVVTSFSYDDCKFVVHIGTGEVRYVGPLSGKYLPDDWLKLKPEQRRVRLNDDAEWEYQEKAIKSYNRLFSYLFNVVHKSYSEVEWFIKDKLKARNKYLRPSSGYLRRLKERADNYIKSLERGVVVC